MLITEVIIVILFLGLLLLIGTPVGISLGLIGLVGLVFQCGAVGFDIAVHSAMGSLNNFILLAVPLFITMGVLLGKGGIGGKIYDVFDCFLKHLPGGVGIATVFTCAVLSAMCGTSVAVAGMVGAFALPNMQKLGYSLPLSMGIVIGGGALGILIPPSVPMILYGAIAQESVGRLFLAGVGPGILAVILFSIYVFIAYRKEGGKVRKRALWSERWSALKEGIWGLLIPILIIILLYTGVATPVEIAALGCILALIVGFLIYKTINIRNIISILKEALSSSIMVLFIIAGAMILAKYVTLAGIDKAVGNIFVGGNIPVWGFLLITMLIILVMGCFLEGASIMLIMLPVLILTIHAYGYDPYVYAILLVINIECAMLTPPIGLNLFAVDGIAKSLNYPSTLGIAVKGSYPFLIIYLSIMLLVAIFPQIALWLPEHMIM
jgi:C4-dicarboxylate transporter DctM subunit